MSMLTDEVMTEAYNTIVEVCQSQDGCYGCFFGENDICLISEVVKDKIGV